MKKSSDPSISNYCVSFIDLLGQREALKGEGLLPPLKSTKDHEEFMVRVKRSVGAIDELQTQAEEFRSHINPFRDRSKFPQSEAELLEEMGRVRAKQQRWSDGLVYFSSLEQKINKCRMNAVFEMFLLTGFLCFIGLASKSPIRGGIEISWGVELHENEIYGPAVANSYALESNVAQYPRIVIGEMAFEYLQSHLNEKPDPTDKLKLYNRNLAANCISMTAIDNDGHRVLDYLGDTFTNMVTYNVHRDLYKEAYQFICSQYELHKANKNTTLAMRYTWLRGYFHQNRERHA